MEDNLTYKQKSDMWEFTKTCINKGRVTHLLKNLGSTTTRHVLDGVCYGLDYTAYKTKPGQGCITTREARRIMNAVGAWEPTDQRAALRTLPSPSSIRLDNGPAYWPVEFRVSTNFADQAWGRVFGIEQGWMEYDCSGYLTWTELGRNRYANRESMICTEFLGQCAFAF